MLGFLAVAALVIVTPGPDTAVTVRSALVGGRRAGVATAAGIALGQVIWAAATSLGLVALLIASEPLFLAIKYAGAAYLVFLGLQTLRRVVSHAHEPERRVEPRRAAPFRQGLLSNLGNPKMAAFFTSLLPQFAPGGQASFAGLLALGLLFAALTLAWLSAYAAAIARAGDVLRRSGVRRAIDAVTGIVLVAFGLRLATEKR